jgi:ferric-dicitrate binding protein FerR (iron transport regulator)
VKAYRNTCRTIFITASLSALVLSSPACSGPSPAETTLFVTNPTDDDQSNAITILSITEGSVFVMRPGETGWISGEAGMILEEDYKIKTGGGGYASITFFEGSTIELEEGTEIFLSELGIDDSATRITIEQGLGKTISRVKKLVDPASSYEVETPAAVAAVRGTTLSVSVSSDGMTVVANIDGLVSVTAQGVEVILPEGTISTVEPGQPPAPPEAAAIATQGRGPEK